MCYDEYLSAGGTKDRLLDYIEHYFLDDQDFPIEDRMLICESNCERNELLYVISNSNRLKLGFEIDDFSDISSWRAIYYTEPGKVHTGSGVGTCGIDDTHYETMWHIYDLLLHDIAMQTEQYVPLDIMQLFSEACFSAAC